MKARVLSGVQPSGSLHIGNYLGALKNWAEIQTRYESIFCIVDLHAVTVYQDPKELLGKIRETAALFIAAGIDPKESSIVVQSSIPGHSELAWLLTCVTPLGWLQRMTQFKAKAENQETVNSGLLQYPVLMAADILLYQASIVPVGIIMRRLETNKARQASLADTAMTERQNWLRVSRTIDTLSDKLRVLDAKLTRAEAAAELDESISHLLAAPKI